MADVLKKYEKQIEKISLIPGGGGVFEVLVDGEVIFSKAQLGRHAEPGEIVRLMDQR
jgi:selenoprotein W-related protein